MSVDLTLVWAGLLAFAVFAYIVMDVLGWQDLYSRYSIAYRVLAWLDTNRPDGLKGGHR